MVSSFDQGNRRADAAVKHAIPNDCNDALAPGAERGGGTRGETGGRSSDGSTPVEQVAQQGSPNTPTTSVPGLEARHDPGNLFPMIPILTNGADTDAD